MLFYVTSSLDGRPWDGGKHTGHIGWKQVRAKQCARFLIYWNHRLSVQKQHSGEDRTWEYKTSPWPDHQWQIRRSYKGQADAFGLLQVHCILF